MSIILEASEIHLRSINDWEPGYCGIQPNGEPPPTAAQWYVTIDDAGVDQTAGAGDDLILTEVYTVEISVWRRLGQLPKDREKDLQRGVSRYLINCQTVDSLERRVLWGMLGKKPGQALGNRQLWRKVANEVVGQLPIEGRGDQILMPLRYVGRSKNETHTDPNGAAWFGRRLRFKGGDRTQSMESMQ